jgi:hypothetical protein
MPADDGSPLGSQWCGCQDQSVPGRLVVHARVATTVPGSGPPEVLNRGHSGVLSGAVTVDRQATAVAAPDCVRSRSSNQVGRSAPKRGARLRLTNASACAGTGSSRACRCMPSRSSVQAPEGSIGATASHSYVRTATAAVVWSGDLPGPLQQILFDAADGITPRAPARIGEHEPAVIAYRPRLLAAGHTPASCRTRTGVMRAVASSRT